MWIVIRLQTMNVKVNDLCVDSSSVCTDFSTGNSSEGIFDITTAVLQDNFNHLIKCHYSEWAASR